MITDQELKEMREAGNGATPGPWEINLRPNGPVYILATEFREPDFIFSSEICVHYTNPDGGRNPEFIVAARNNWTRLLDEVELLASVRASQASMITKLAKENEALKAEVDRLTELSRCRFEANSIIGSELREWKARAEKLAEALSKVEEKDSSLHSDQCNENDCFEVIAHEAIADYRASMKGEE